MSGSVAFGGQYGRYKLPRNLACRRRNQWWATGLNFNDFKAQDLAYFNQGLRLISLRNHGGTYTGIWHPGTGAQWWVAGLNFNDFKAQDLAYFNQGLRLVDIEVVNGVFSAVCVPAAGRSGGPPDSTSTTSKPRISITSTRA